MAEASSGPNWQNIIGCSIAGGVLVCIFMALGLLAFIFMAPILSYGWQALT